MSRPKTGGRTAGTPNKRTAELKKFLGGVFDAAYADPKFRALLISQIKNLTIDTKLLITLLAYDAGAPPKQHNHDVGPSLAALIAGTAEDEDAEDGEE